MDSSWRRWRVALLLVGAFLLIDAVIVVVFMMSDQKRPARGAEPSATAAAVDVINRPASRSVAASVLSAPRNAPSARPPSSVVWPERAPNPAVRATWNANYGDPFDGETHDGPRDVRVLTTVGAFRLGVTNDSKVRDEAATVVILQELGAEIDKLDSGRAESYERRVVEYQEIFDKYRPRLAGTMEGSFALKGNGWSDTEPLVKPEGHGDGGHHAH